MSQLDEDIKRYTQFFTEEASRCHIRNAAGHHIVTCADGNPPVDWLPPAIAVKAVLENPSAFAMKRLKYSAIVGVPAIENWVKNCGVSGLSFIKEGSDAAFFEAYIDDFPSLQSGFRIGEYTNIRKRPDAAKKWHRAWSPLVLQPYSQSILAFKTMDEYSSRRLSIEHLPLVAIMPERMPERFNWFLNDWVLKNTPYEVDGHKDLGILSNGTPVYVDPDSLNFKSTELAHKHFKDQFRPAWQQEIMGTIFENCKALGLTEPLNWVQVSGPENSFITTQSVLYPRPFPERPPERALIRVKDLTAVA